MLPPLLSLEELTVRHGSTLAVDRLSLTVERGEVFGLLGPNGSGKSSTLSVIAGERPGTAGEVRVSGLREADAPLDYRRRIGLTPQELAVYTELSAEANLRFFGKLYGLRGKELARRVAEVLALTRLTEQARRPAYTYSGGMLRRLNLGCALLHSPELLLLDEPTVGLDIQSRDAIFDSLRELRTAGTGIVFTTHHLEEAEQLCDRIGILDQGRLIALGTLGELARGGGRRESLRLPRPPVEVRHDAPHGLSGPRLPRRPRLETVYLELTGRGLRAE